MGVAITEASRSSPAPRPTREEYATRRRLKFRWCLPPSEARHTSLIRPSRVHGSVMLSAQPEEGNAYLNEEARSRDEKRVPPRPSVHSPPRTDGLPEECSNDEQQFQFPEPVHGCGPRV